MAEIKLERLKPLITIGICQNVCNSTYSFYSLEQRTKFILCRGGRVEERKNKVVK